VNPFGIGDVIFSFWMTEAIRKAKGNCVIDYVCNERTCELVGLNPSIRKVHIFNRDDLRRTFRKNPIRFFGKLAQLLEAVRVERYDLSFDLSMGRQYAFFLMCLGIRCRLGFDYKGRGSFLTDKIPIKDFDEKPVRDTYVSLVARWLGGVPLSPSYPVLQLPREMEQDGNTWCENQGIQRNGSVVIVAPGGGKSWGANAVYKQWDPSRFAETAAYIHEKSGSTLVFLGDKSEEGLLEAVREKARQRRDEPRHKTPFSRVRRGAQGHSHESPQETSDQ